MAIRFQYNKTSLLTIEKQLKMRQRALPTIKSKESALRMEVKKAKLHADAIAKALNAKIASYEDMLCLWEEFDASHIRIKDINLKSRKIAGIAIPELESIVFEDTLCHLFLQPLWYSDGIRLLKNMAELAIEQELSERTIDLLEDARKKTTRKVNLFEKVQIPGYEDAIRKIKRFMEDEENLSKASQKIMKSKISQEEVAS